MGRYGADVLFTGQSGKTYEFELWEIDSTWAEVPAVFIATRKAYSRDGLGVYPVLRCGETTNLREYLSSDRIINRFKDAGARMICVRREPTKVVREAICKDIRKYIQNHAPVEGY